MVGLGNPGDEFEGTRHNAGFWLADALASRWHLPRWTRQGNARVAGARIPEGKVQLLKPLLYMNDSGRALRGLRVPSPDDTMQDVLILVDDFAIDAGTFRLRASGSSGGHNGLKSVEAAFNTRHYARLRVGVGPKPAGVDQAKFVLGDMAKADRKAVHELIPVMCEAVECWAAQGIDRAMAQFNRKAQAEE